MHSWLRGSHWQFWSTVQLLQLVFLLQTNAGLSLGQTSYSMMAPWEAGGVNTDVSVWKSEVNILAGCGGPFLTVEAVQLLPRDTHWPEHHWQPLVFAVQL